MTAASATMKHVRGITAIANPRGAAGAAIDQSIQRARQRYAETTHAQPVVDHAADTDGDDLLSGLGLEDDVY
jgi:hypothetical protein